VLFTLGQLLRAWQKRHATQVQQITRLDEATQQLISANMGFQKYADSIEEKSAEEERKRITQEIHDTVAYTLVNIMMMLREASIICGKNRKLRKIHDQVLVEAQTGLNETRRALRILRASRQSRISAASEIHKLTTAFANATGVQVCVEYGNVQESLEAGLYTCVFHMIQEGMANALRHGRATKIDVHLWQTDSELLLYLRDNGAGCGAIEEGMGLSGMRERIQSLGGSFTAGNAHEGFQISARLPCGESSDG
jgi:signal transduction histidine kinase